MSVEAMKQALEALEKIDGAMPFPVGRSAITALRTAIEQAEKQEPVAWVDEMAEVPEHVWEPDYYVYNIDGVYRLADPQPTIRWGKK